MTALPFGASVLPGGRVAFRFWAPACEGVKVETADGRQFPMQRASEGWFEAELSLAAGTRYRYRVRDDLAVPDPASRFQPQDVHGPSEVVDPDAYAWLHPEWRGRPWHETVLHELHAGACGGFDGVRERLPRLAELGITAIELMPVADTPGRRNWGYDGVLPFAPDHELGTPAQLKALIDAAHGLSLSVFLDVVYNHFGPDGNFLSAYAPSFFRDDVETPWGAAIDFRRPQVRQFFIENALYWLREYRFDGLRFDAVHAITDPSFVDDLGAAVRAAIEPSRHVHLVLENEHNGAAHLGYRHGRRVPPAFDAQWNDDGHNVLHVLLTGEAEGYYAPYVEGTEAKLARVLAEGFAHQGGPADRMHGKVRGTPSAHLPPTAFVLFLQNHDQVGNRAFGERLTTLADPEALRAAVTLQLLCPQIPLLFMGEEWGCRSPFLFFTDFHDELADAVREGRRREFAKFAAFTDEKRRATIPDPNADSTFERSRPEHAEADERCRDWYRRLLAIRRERITPRLPGARALGAQPIGPRAVRALWALGDGATLDIVVNLGSEAIAFDPLAGVLLVDSAQFGPANSCAGSRARREGASVCAPRSTRVYLTEAAR